MIIDLGKKGKQYSKFVPVGYEHVGAICNDDGKDPGMLVINKRTGEYAKCNYEIIRPLNQAEAIMAVAESLKYSAPTGGKSGKTGDRKLPVMVNLDQASIDILRRLGHGNLSAGVREAARLADIGAHSANENI